MTDNLAGFHDCTGVAFNCKDISPDFRRAAFFIATGVGAVHAAEAEACRHRRGWKLRPGRLRRAVRRWQHCHCRWGCRQLTGWLHDLRRDGYDRALPRPGVSTTPPTCWWPICRVNADLYSPPQGGNLANVGKTRTAKLHGRKPRAKRPCSAFCFFRNARQTARSTRVPLSSETRLRNLVCQHAEC